MSNPEGQRNPLGLSMAAAAIVRDAGSSLTLFRAVIRMLVSARGGQLTEGCEIRENVGRVLAQRR
jgi:hypothetical protein